FQVEIVVISIRGFHKVHVVNPVGGVFRAGKHVGNLLGDVRGLDIGGGVEPSAFGRERSVPFCVSVQELHFDPAVVLIHINQLVAGIVFREKLANRGRKVLWEVIVVVVRVGKGFDQASVGQEIQIEFLFSLLHFDYVK